MASHIGYCNCGAVTVDIDNLPKQTAACHCHNCRRAGGAYSINYIVSEDQATIRDPGESMKMYEDLNTNSGRLTRRNFCQSCGSPIYSISEAMPGQLVVKASLFENVVPSKVDVFSEREIHWDETPS